MYGEPVSAGASPRGTAPISDPAALHAALPVKTPRRSILLVEDDEPLRRMMSIALRFASFETREARSGMEALAILDRWRPDLVVLDLVLPGIDGLAVQQELASQPGTQKLPVVVITASELPLDGVDVACVLRKPFRMDELLAAIQNCLRTSGA
jgi:two-component system, OmpR family, response regulator